MQIINFYKKKIEELLSTHNVHAQRLVLSKELIRTNKLLSLSTKTYMPIAYSIKILIITLSKEIDKNK